MDRRTALATGVAFLATAGCSTKWKVAYETGVAPEVSRGWRLRNVVVNIPADLTVSNSNTFAPGADIVWHGEPFGDRRAQVATILDEGITQGGRRLAGRRPVNFNVSLLRFHAVTPAAVSRSPGAVHNIRYSLQVVDASSGAPVVPAEVISADLEAYVGAAAVTAAINGQTQRSRIVSHLDLITQGWLGFGADQRRTFASFGR